MREKLSCVLVCSGVYALTGASLWIAAHGIPAVLLVTVFTFPISVWWTFDAIADWIKWSQKVC